LESDSVRIVRLTDRPIVGPDSHPSIGANLNGPSLIKVPAWIPDPLGAYYLYFSHHKGDHIRMASADVLTGPWTVHPGGVLALADSRFLTKPPETTAEEIAFIEQCYIDALGEHELPNGLLGDITIPHIASPDVRVNDSYRTITMYFHGLEGLGNQLTRHATSLDGLTFDVDPPKIEETYLRGFRHNETEYAIVMPGKILRRAGRPTEFEEGPNLLPRTARHTAVDVVGDQIRLYWTRVGDTPERILLSTIDATVPWTEWEASSSVEILRPEFDWEGANEELTPSIRSEAPGRANQLRDPAIFVEDSRKYLVYAVAGERGLAIAELVDL
jgi:hypothetical protein